LNASPGRGGTTRRNGTCLSCVERDDERPEPQAPADLFELPPDEIDAPVENPVPGETLGHDDIEHFEAVLTAIREALRLVTAVDAVIVAHGGWPTAFSSVRPSAAAV
jgi:hypothetical protein